MLKKAFTDRAANDSKTALASIVLVANTFIWYLYTGRFLTNITEGFPQNEISAVWGVNVFATSAAALFGVFAISSFRKRLSFLWYWMAAGIALSLIPLAINITDFNVLILYFALIGVYFGLGMPVSLAYFASSTRSGNRSKLGGITFLAIFIGVFFLGIAQVSDIGLNAIILASCKLAGLAIIAILKPTEKEIMPESRISYRSVLKNKPFLLYFIPWVGFSIINYMSTPIVNKIFPDFFAMFVAIENIIAALTAVFCGFIADYVGRKKLVISGFILLGIAYGSLGLFQKSSYTWWFYTAVDGLAWGVFYAIFLMTIWGDIAKEKSSEKYYAIGYLPFLFSVLTELSIGSSISSSLNETAVFSFASIFMFIAVLPLAYAPEPLEKNIKDRELQDYIEKATKARSSKSS